MNSFFSLLVGFKEYSSSLQPSPSQRRPSPQRALRLPAPPPSPPVVNLNSEELAAIMDEETQENRRRNVM